MAALAERVAEGGRPLLVGRCGATHSGFDPVARALAGSGQVQRLLEEDAAALPSVVTALLGMPSTGSREPAEAGPDTSEELVATGVATVLRQLAAGGPVLLVLDDVDRVNASSAVLLGHLVERLPAGVLVVLAYRDPPGARHAPLLGLLGAVASRAVAERIVLGPLTEVDLADLVRDRAPSRRRRPPRPPPVGTRRWKPLLRGRAVHGRRNGSTEAPRARRYPPVCVTPYVTASSTCRSEPGTCCPWPPSSAPRSTSSSSRRSFALPRTR